MKWYFATRRKYQNKLNGLIHVLSSNNQTVECDWTTLDDLMPYQENQGKCESYAQMIYRGIANADVFVMISDAGGTDMFIELGLALAQSEIHHKPRVYVVGAHNQRSLMHFHPLIKRMDSIWNVFKEENVNLPVENIDISFE
jgi:hypothetical protein